MHVYDKYRIDILPDVDVSSIRNHAQHGRCGSVVGFTSHMVSNTMMNAVQHAAAPAVVAQASS